MPMLHGFGIKETGARDLASVENLRFCWELGITSSEQADAAAALPLQSRPVHGGSLETGLLLG